MSVILALFAAIQCGISTSPLGGLTAGCNGGYPPECECSG